MNIFENEASCAGDGIAIAIETNYNPYLTVWWYYPWYRMFVAKCLWCVHDVLVDCW